MASWVERERRGRGWQAETLESISAPPLALVAFLAVVAMFVYLTTLSDATERVQKKRSGFMFRVLLLPIVVSLVIILNMVRTRMVQQLEVVGGEPMRQVAAEDWSSASGVILVLVLVLVMVYYQPSFQSAWFRIF